MSQLETFSNSPIKASSIIGTDVINPKNESLGDIKDIVIDPRTGKVAYIVLEFGGFLSLGQKLFAIPFSVFEYNVTKDKYILDVPLERLKTAPGFNAAQMFDEKWHIALHEHFDRLPYWG